MSLCCLRWTLVLDATPTGGPALPTCGRGEAADRSVPSRPSASSRRSSAACARTSASAARSRSCRSNSCGVVQSEHWWEGASCDSEGVMHACFTNCLFVQPVLQPALDYQSLNWGQTCRVGGAAACWGGKAGLSWAEPAQRGLTKSAPAVGGRPAAMFFLACASSAASVSRSAAHLRESACVGWAACTGCLRSARACLCCFKHTHAGSGPSFELQPACTYLSKSLQEYSSA